jgi:mRNA interferase YafQ
MREIVPTTAFRKDFKRLSASGRNDMERLKEVVKLLVLDAPLGPQLRDHVLTGNWMDHRECHLRPDWLLIYRLEPGRLVLVRTGTHSDLFNK